MVGDLFSKSRRRLRSRYFERVLGYEAFYGIGNEFRTACALILLILFLNLSSMKGY
jgi:hypothetical protein